MGPMKHTGLALALSVASSVQFGLLALFLRKKGLFIHAGPILKSVSKSVIATLVMGTIVFICHSKWFYTTATNALSEKILSLSALVLIGIVVYFLIARLMGCQEIRAVWAMVGLKRTK